MMGNIPYMDGMGLIKIGKTALLFATPDSHWPIFPKGRVCLLNWFHPLISISFWVGFICPHKTQECLFAWWKSKAGRRYEGVGRQDPVVRCPTCRQKHKRHEVENLGDEKTVREVVWMTWQGFWTHSIATSPTQVGFSLVLDTILMAKILLWRAPIAKTSRWCRFVSPLRLAACFFRICSQ